MSSSSPTVSEPAYRAVFRCVGGCHGEFDLSQVIYRCPTCGGLLEVHHDQAALAQRSAQAWKELFAERWRLPSSVWGSGVWGKHEWVAPHVTMEHVVSLGEGVTPLLAVPRYAHSIGLTQLWVKQCGTSHTGSFKDLGMTVLVSCVNQMIAQGQPIRALACASTGDTSAALAAYGAAAGIPVVVLLPEAKVSAAQLVQPLAHGALVCSLATDFDGCMAVVQALTEDPTIYLANSMNSLRVEGQKTIAIEIAQQLDWEVPQWVVVPGGNLGNISAVAKGFAQLRALGLVSAVPRLVCAQAEAANPLYRGFVRAQAEGRPLRMEDVVPQVAATTLASAIQIGDPVSRAKAVAAIREFDGVVEQASEAELADAVARADRFGLFNCPHTGVALACVEKLVRAGTIAADERVVVISTAHGLKFTEFKTRYHSESLGFAVKHANGPIALGKEPAEVVGRLHRLLDARAR